MDTPPQVAVVIVSYNTKDLLLDCLRSVIQTQSSIETEIIVVDNASSDGSPQSVEAQFPEVSLIANQKNVGFGSACNQAIKKTSAPFILLLNSDAQVTSGATQSLLDVMNKNDRCAAAGCGIVDSNGKPTSNTRYFLTPTNQALEMLGGHSTSRRFSRTYRPAPDQLGYDCNVDWIDGACLLLRRSALDEVGLFDERFFMYSEDEDLCFRFRKHGWLVCYTTGGTVTHRGGASSEADRAGLMKEFYLSQLMFLSRNQGTASASVYVKVMKAALMLKWLRAQLLSTKGTSAEMAARFSALAEAASSMIDR